MRVGRRLKLVNRSLKLRRMRVLFPSLAGDSLWRASFLDIWEALAEAKAAIETYEYSATMEIERDEAEALLRDAEKFFAQVKTKLKIA